MSAARGPRGERPTAGLPGDAVVAAIALDGATPSTHLFERLRRFPWMPPAASPMALMLGAAGVALGTRFHATDEAAGFRAAKRRIVEASADDSLRSVVFDVSRSSVWPVPFTGRCLLDEHRSAGRVARSSRCPLDKMGSRHAAARAAGDFEIAVVIAGEAAATLHEISSAAAVIEGMVDMASTLLHDGAALPSHAARRVAVAR